MPDTGTVLMRLAIFVDAGYLYGGGFAALVGSNQFRADGEFFRLRIYWYDGVVVGLMGFMVCASLTIYFIGQENKEPPVEQSAPAATPGGIAEANPVEYWRRRRAYLRGKRRQGV